MMFTILTFSINKLSITISKTQLFIMLTIAMLSCVFIVMLSVVMLNVIRLGVFMHNVMAPGRVL
jgi:hypothetical protein